MLVDDEDVMDNLPRTNGASRTPSGSQECPQGGIFAIKRSRSASTYQIMRTEMTG